MILPYDNELKALKRSGRYRQRYSLHNCMYDAASNDYLGLSHVQSIHDDALSMMSRYPYQAPKASMLVGGYHPIHEEFETALAEANGFEAGLIMGSGFNANIGLMEALVRKGDTLIMDSEYHASGILGSKLCDGNVVIFDHNNSAALGTALENNNQGRIIVAVEGIYSMSGDLLDRNIIDLCISKEVILIIDEAHSSGVIGKNLMGVLDHYDIAPTPLMIKMGTLGKAYGSFGAYVLATQHIIDYLVNRAKNVIYATAPSLYETARGLCALRYIQKNTKELKEKIQSHQNSIKAILNISVPGLIVPIVIGDNKRVIEIRQIMEEEMNVCVGAIRQPTVEKAIIRLIARLDLDHDFFIKVCERLAQITVK